MKVIIQDIAGNEFLGVDGRWVSDKAQAKDFSTLMRAYHFAQANTSIHFRVLLHCPDDDYSACIIEGVGMAGEGAAQFCLADREAARKQPKAEPVAGFLASRFDASRLHLN